MARKAGKVSIFTMAAELGISAATVSRVLNNRTGPGEETRRAVLKLARKYDFKLNYPQQHKPLRKRESLLKMRKKPKRRKKRRRIKPLWKLPRRKKKRRRNKNNKLPKLRLWKASKHRKRKIR